MTVIIHSRHLVVAFFSLPSGLTLTGDEDGCGCVVKSVLKGGAVGLDGRIGVGDHIVAVNNESMIGLSGHRARYPNISLKFSCAYRGIFEAKLEVMWKQLCDEIE